MIIYFLDLVEKTHSEQDILGKYQMVSGRRNLFVTYVGTACSSSVPKRKHIVILLTVKKVSFFIPSPYF
jgi:hypothetical protein